MKRLREVYVELEPEKMLPVNKRTKFPESGSHNSTTWIRKIPQFYITRKSVFWARLALRGLFSDFQVDAAMHRNRPLYNLGRLICHRIHENCIEYMEKELPAIVTRNTVPDLVEVEQILEGMCEKVLKIEENGKVYELYVDKMMSVVTKLFTGERMTVKLDLHSEIMKTLVTICENKKVEASSEEMTILRDGFLRNFYFMAADLMAFILSTTAENNKNNIVLIHGYRSLDAYSNSLFYRVEDDVSQRLMLNRLSTLLYRHLTRNLSASLWTVIPFEESDHLLEHVLEYGLIQVLPENAKEFLTEWMIGIRTRMREHLRLEELQKCVKRVFGEKEKKFTLKPNDDRLRKFLLQGMNFPSWGGHNHSLLETCGKMLNTPDFKLVAGDWQIYLLFVFQTKQKIVVEPYEKFFEVSEKILPDAYAQLAAHFSNFPPDQAMLYHTTAQLLRFAVSFVCSTVRQVFIHDGSGKLTYNGKLEEETTDFGVFHEYKKYPLNNVSGTFEYPPEKKSRREQERKSSTESPESVLEKKFTLNPAKKSFAVKPCSASTEMKQEPDLSADVTNEELNAARALRQASMTSEDQEFDDDEKIPEEWRKMYKLLVQSDIELRDQRNRIEKQFNYFCK